MGKFLLPVLIESCFRMVNWKTSEMAMWDPGVSRLSWKLSHSHLNARIILLKSPDDLNRTLPVPPVNMGLAKVLGGNGNLFHIFTIGSKLRISGTMSRGVSAILQNDPESIMKYELMFKNKSCIFEWGIVQWYLEFSGLNC